MIKYSPRTSALYRELFQEQAQWSVTDHLLASILDTEQLALWMASDTKKNKRPKPVMRPGQEPEAPAHQFGNADSAVSKDEFWTIWNSTAEQLQIEA